MIIVSYHQQSFGTISDSNMTSSSTVVQKDIYIYSPISHFVIFGAVFGDA
jgi:hypothetical protein